MNYLTKFGLNLLQKAKLDYFIIRALNNGVCNPLLLKYCWQTRNYFSFYEQHEEWKKKLGKSNITFKDKRILEVGAGGSIGLGYFFLPENFKFWLATDAFQNLPADRRLIKREIRLIHEIIANHNPDVIDEAEIKENRIIFGRRFDFKKLEADKLDKNLINKFDIVLSSAVMEHIPRELVKKSLANLSGYLKSGGIMINEIDLRDHINVANSFNFYKYSETSWNKLTGGTIFYTNRLRINDYSNILENLKLRILILETQTAPLSGNLKINEYFNQYTKEELEITRAFIISKKQ